MTKSQRHLTTREHLRWQRAMDERLIDAIFGRVVRDVPLPLPTAALQLADGAIAAIAPRA